MDVEVRLHADDIERYRLQGRMVPLPRRVRGIVDSAAMRTCISERTTRAMLLEPVDYVTLHAASGESKSGVHHLSLQLDWRQDRPPDPISVRAQAVPEVLGADVLIGLDVLRHGELVLFGPDSRYELLLPRTTRPVP